MTRYADKTSYAENSQSSGHVDLHRTVRSASQKIAGEGGVVSGRFIGKDRDSEKNHFRVGVRQPDSRYRQIPTTCESLKSQNRRSFTQKIVSGKFSEKCAFAQIPLLTNALLSITMSPVNQNGSPNQVKASSFRPVLIDVKTMRKAGLLPLTMKGKKSP